MATGGGLAAESLRCGCEDKFCRRPRLSQGIRIFHYRRKWHRLQILLSIQALSLSLSLCVCVCVCVCVYRTAEEMQAFKHKSMHCTCIFCLWFSSSLVFSVCCVFFGSCMFSLPKLHHNNFLLQNRRGWLASPPRETRRKAQR